MIVEPRSCLLCGGLIPSYMRKDSVFCDVPCRQAYWEKTGKRHEKAQGSGLGLNDNSSDNISILKASGIDRLKERIEKELNLGLKIKGDDLNGTKRTNNEIL